MTPPADYDSDTSATTAASSDTTYGHNDTSSCPTHACVDEYESESDEYDVDDEWVCERVVNRKYVDGRAHYLIKWRNYYTPTWHAGAELDCKSMLREFDLHHQTNTRIVRHADQANPNRKVTHQAVWAQDCTWKLPRVGGKRLTANRNSSSVSLARQLTNAVHRVKATCERAPVTYGCSRSRTVEVQGRQYTVDGVDRPVRGTGDPLLFENNKLVLFHGTSSLFASSIMLSGFRLPKERSGHGVGAILPHMFGKGVYLTSSLEKARHFGTSVLACEVTLGASKVMNGAELELTKDSLKEEGFDSVYAPPGCGGNVFDEYVIFNPRQALILGCVK